MSDVIDLRGQPAQLEDNQEFIADLCRFAENILSEAAVKKKYRFDDATWEALGSNDALVKAVENEKTRRIRSGQQKREKAQQLVVKAPDVVAAIMLDDNANARHRIDASKTLNDFAANGPGQGAPAADRFQIVINLGADVQLKYDRSRAPDPNDPYNDIDTSVVAAIAAKKTDGGSGEPL